MSEYSQDYFKQTEHGESRWWSWVMVFWFTMLGWLASQMIFTSPLGAVLESADPELNTKMTEVSLSLFTGDTALMLGALFLP